MNLYIHIYICIYAVMQHVIYKVTNNRSYKKNALEKKSTKFVSKM